MALSIYEAEAEWTEAAAIDGGYSRRGFMYVAAEDMAGAVKACQENTSATITIKKIQRLGVLSNAEAVASAVAA